MRHIRLLQAHLRLGLMVTGINLLAQAQIHLIHRAINGFARYARGRPRPRVAITFRWTSDVPPRIVAGTIAT